jgi:hypothetical protein
MAAWLGGRVSSTARTLCVGVERARVSWLGWLVGTLLGPEGSGRHVHGVPAVVGVGVGVVWLFGSSLWLLVSLVGVGGGWWGCCLRSA